MSIEKIRAQIKASIWQAIAQSGVDLSSIPQANQEKLISKIADSMLITINSIMSETARVEAPASPNEDDGTQEKVLWQGRPFLSLVETYVITNERLKIVKGLLGRDVEIFELIRLQDIDFKQNVSERMFGIGDIFIRGHDPSNPEIVLRNITDPEGVYEILRKAWLAARKRHGMQFREYM
jgi:hypothetical protein